MNCTAIECQIEAIRKFVLNPNTSRRDQLALTDALLSAVLNIVEQSPPTPIEKLLNGEFAKGGAA